MIGFYGLLPGCKPHGQSHIHFCVWSPRSQSVAVRLARAGESLEASKWIFELQRERSIKLTHPQGRDGEDGYFSALVPEAEAGMLYKFRLETGEFPDPASRFQ